MTRLLIDSSVLIKWLHSDGETEIQEARSIRAAHLAGDVEARIIDLALYEVGNVLLRALRWPSNDVADQLDDLLARIDREAKRRATSRSALLALAASRELERRDSEEVAQAITRSEQRFRGSGAFDAAELIRNERDSSP